MRWCVILTVIATMQGTGFVIGPCAAFDEPDEDLCLTLEESVPRFAGVSNNTIMQLTVTAYHLSIPRLLTISVAWGLC